MDFLFHLPSVTIYGIILLVVGIFLRLKISQRRFNRRGVAGLQHFESYWTGLVMSTLEWILTLVSALMILSGLVLLLVEWYNLSVN